MTHDKAPCSRALRLVSTADQNQTQAQTARWEAILHCCTSLDSLFLTAYVVFFIAQMEGGGGRTVVEKEAERRTAKWTLQAASDKPVTSVLGASWQSLPNLSSAAFRLKRVHTCDADDDCSNLVIFILPSYILSPTSCRKTFRLTQNIWK